MHQSRLPDAGWRYARATRTNIFFANTFSRAFWLAKDIVGGGHCMTPSFLKNQLGRSLRNMRVDCVDVFYLHNPETQLGGSCPRRIFCERIREAFTFLESAVVAGEIQYYGVATWNAFRQEAAGARLDATRGTGADRAGNRRRAAPFPVCAIAF